MIVVWGFAELQRKLGIAKNVFSVRLQKRAWVVGDHIAGGWTKPAD